MQEIFTNEEAAKPSKKAKNIVALGLSSLALAMGFYVFITQQAIQQNVNSLKVAMQKQEAQVKQLGLQQEELSQNLKANASAMENSSNHLQQTLSQIGKTTSNWSIEEAIYLIRLANINLYVQHHLPVAIKLLQAAEQQLQGATDPKVLPIRQKLINNISALQAIPEANIENAMMQLQALLSQLSTLTLKINNNFNLTESAVKDIPAKEFKYPWLAGLYKVGENIRQLIVIRRHDELVKPLPTEQQLGYIVQNIGILLQEAQWALLQGDQALYANSLAQTKGWLADYFDIHSSVGQHFLQVLEQLSQLKLKPELPELVNVLPELAALKKA